MKVEYDPAAPRGSQFKVDGVQLGRVDAAAALRSAGLSINQAFEKLAEAKLRAAQQTGAA